MKRAGSWVLVALALGCASEGTRHRARVPRARRSADAGVVTDASAPRAATRAANPAPVTQVAVSAPSGTVMGRTYVSVPPPEQTEETPAPSEVESEAVERHLRALRGQLQVCYERELERDPHLSGRLDVRFVMDGRGVVTEAHAEGFAEVPTLRACVEEMLRGETFPAPERGPVELRMQMVFNPLR